MKKNAVLRVIALCMMLAIAMQPVTAFAKTSSETLADVLYAQGLFLGTGTTERDEPIFALSGSVTRAQAVTMLVRILGKEKKHWPTVTSIQSPLRMFPHGPSHMLATHTPTA